MTQTSETVTATISEEKLYCTVHPDVETSLRCNRCGRPMCTRCAVRTPVGYRCKECVRGQQQTFFNASTRDQIIQAAISVVLGAVATGLVSLFLGMLGFYGLFLAFIAGSAVGGGIADLAHRAAGRRRGRYSWLVVAGGIGAGAMIGGLISGAMLFELIGWMIFTGFAISAAVGRLRLGR